MIPEEASKTGEVVSGWRLRQEVEAAGYPVTTAQLTRYERWGLLGPRVDGGWPHEAVGRLIKARQLESEVRSMPRRVLLMRADFLRFPIDAASVHRALIALAPAVKDSRRKAQKVEQALAVVAGRWGHSSGRTLQAHVIPTSPHRAWADLLAAAKTELVDARVGGWYSWVNWVLPGYLDDGAPDLSDIPIEEQVLILAVRDLDADKRQRAWLRMQATRQT